jgi:hypothetical protein
MRKAKSFHRRSLSKVAFERWTIKIGRVKVSPIVRALGGNDGSSVFRTPQALAQTAYKWQTERDATLVSGAFKAWRARAAETTLQAARQDKMLKQCLSTWRGRMRTCRRQAGRSSSVSAINHVAHFTLLSTAQAEAIQAEHQLASVRRCLNQWCQQHKQKALLSQAADLYRQEQLLRHAFSNWKASAATISTTTIRADVLRAFFLERQSLRSWIKRSKERQQERFVKAKKMEMLRGYFDGKFRSDSGECSGGA